VSHMYEHTSVLMRMCIEIHVLEEEGGARSYTSCTNVATCTVLGADCASVAMSASRERACVLTHPSVHAVTTSGHTRKGKFSRCGNHAHAHAPTQAGEFAHEHAAARGSARVSERAANTSTLTCGHRLRASPQALPHRSPPPLQQERCLRPPASQGSWKQEEEGAQSGLGLGGLHHPGTPHTTPVRLLPQRLGIGHSPRPVDVQVPAADGGERGPV